MRLLPLSLRDVLSPSATPASTTDTLLKRVFAPAICHGAGCLSVPQPDFPSPTPSPPSSPPPPPAPASTSRDGTVTVSETITVHINETIISWRTAYDTIISVNTATQNITLTATSTVTQNIDVAMTRTVPTTITMTPAPTAAAAKDAVQAKKGLQAGDILAIILAVIIMLLVALMWFLVRRFYRMYRAERVLRKQIQTEGVELKTMPNVSAGTTMTGVAAGSAVNTGDVEHAGEKDWFDL